MRHILGANVLVLLCNGKYGNSDAEVAILASREDDPLAIRPMRS